MSSEPMSSETLTDLALGKLAYERHVEVHEGLCAERLCLRGMAPWEALSDAEQLRWARTAAAPWALGVSQGADDVLRRLRGRQNIVITDAMISAAIYESCGTDHHECMRDAVAAAFETAGFVVVEDDR